MSENGGKKGLKLWAIVLASISAVVAISSLVFLSCALSHVCANENNDAVLAALSVVAYLAAMTGFIVGLVQNTSYLAGKAPPE